MSERPDTVQAPVALVPALLVTHGGLGAALLGAARAIAGDITAVEALSNEGLSRDALVAAVSERVAAFGPAGGIVFADVAGGSCAQAALTAAARGIPGPVRVLCGVNLPMVLDYLHNRTRLEPAALADHVLARGRVSVQLLEPPAALPDPEGGGVSVALVRVDDRLLHGQVLLAWGCALAADRYIVADDALAASPFESALVESCGGESAVEIVALEEGARRVLAEETRPGVAVVLVRGLPEVLALARAVRATGGRLERVNLGGMHHAPGKERVHDFVYLGPDDRAALAALRELSVRVIVQDVPASTPFDAPPAWSARVA